MHHMQYACILRVVCDHKKIEKVYLKKKSLHNIKYIKLYMPKINNMQFSKIVMIYCEIFLGFYICSAPSPIHQLTICTISNKNRWTIIILVYISEMCIEKQTETSFIIYYRCKT